MKVKQTIVIALTLIGVSCLLFTPIAAADDTQLQCGSVKTSVIGGSACSGIDDKSGDLQSSGIFAILRLVIQIMTAGVGVLAVGGLVYGAVLYVSAADSAEQVKKARTIITGVVIGIIAYGLMFAILNYIIPGGLFKP